MIDVEFLIVARSMFGGTDVFAIKRWANEENELKEESSCNSRSLFLIHFMASET